MIKFFLLLILALVTLFASDYSNWLKSQNTQYQTYKKSMDDEFSEMLKNDWEAFQTMYLPSPYKKPKPKSMPKIQKEMNIPKKEIFSSVKITPKKIQKVSIKRPSAKTIMPLYGSDFKSVAFKFYNQNIKIEYDKKFLFILSKINKDSISSVWQILSKTKFKKFIKQIEDYSNQYALNDWAKYLLIYKTATHIYHDKNRANLFTWFILVKMGYDTKVAYASNSIYLLSTVKEKLYQIAFFKFNNEKYYILTPMGRVKSVGSIYTYPSSYPNANKKLSFSMNQKPIKFFTNIEVKNLKFNFFQNKYTIKSQFSKDLIDFYKNFPQSAYPLYFNSKKSPEIYNSLLLQLKPLIDGKTEIEAVNLLLRFVQTAFQYKTDNIQFGYEKVFFPEETLYYPYSDCEDRSIIFAYLVKNLLGLEVVGIKYSNHLSTAVKFSTKINGDSIIYKNRVYTICDPTYINANCGMAMPQYKHKSFSVIE